MKRLKTFCLLLMILFLATGCYDYKIEMTVHDDKSVDFGMDLNVDFSALKDMYGDEFEISDEDLMDEMDTESASGFDEEDIKALEENGYTFKETKDGLKYGVAISKKFDNIDDISTENEVKVNLDSISEKDFDNIFFTAKKGLFKTTYSAYFIIDLTTEEMEDMDEISAYKDSFDITYSVNLPNESNSNNASNLTNDSKTLNWDLELGKKNEVIYEFDMVNKNQMYMVIGGGIAAVVVLAIAAVAIVKTSKKKNTEQTM